MNDVTEQSILDYLLSQAIQPLDEATEINIIYAAAGLVRLELGLPEDAPVEQSTISKKYEKQATELINRLVDNERLELLPVKRRCPITGRPSRAWRRVGMVENAEAGS